MQKKGVIKVSKLFNINELIQEDYYLFENKLKLMFNRLVCN